MIPMAPTPNARDWRSPNRVDSESPFSMLNEAIHKAGMLPTPRTRGLLGGSGSKEMMQAQVDAGQISVEDASGLMGVQMCPTPWASDYKGASAQTVAKGRDPLTNSCMDAIENSPDGTRTGLRLHPDFVEWMQGYPIGWTELKPSETASDQE